MAPIGRSADGRDDADVNAQVGGRCRRAIPPGISGEWKGHTGKRIHDVVNIGIGGSTSGSVMVTEVPAVRQTWHISGALLCPQRRWHAPPRCSASSIRRPRLHRPRPSPRRRLDERAVGAGVVGGALLGSEAAVPKHFVAVSTAEAEVKKFGIDPAAHVRVLGIGVGGRYSLWSAIGLSIACTIGMDSFEALLAGARTTWTIIMRAPPEFERPGHLLRVRGLHLELLRRRDARHPSTISISIASSPFPAGRHGEQRQRRSRRPLHRGLHDGPIVWASPGPTASTFYQLASPGHPPRAGRPWRRWRRTTRCSAIADKVLLANCIAQTEALHARQDEEEARAELHAGRRA
ncbi:MAG: hypothetical protein U0235_18535 [Polyangiaceae bacterium]